jgi:hypothetical protein
MNSQQLVSHYQLKVGDAIECVRPQDGFPKHYAIYAGRIQGEPSFIANTTTGVRIVHGEELQSFMAKYEVTTVERFQGTPQEARSAISRARKRIGEDEYSLILNNCEHFKNEVLYGESRSNQVATIAKAFVAGGLGLIIASAITKKKGLQKAGLIIMSIPLVLFLLALLLRAARKPVLIDTAPNMLSN